MKHSVELQEVIDKAHKSCLNTKKYNKHLERGTLDTFYSQILSNTVKDLIALPVERAAQGLDPEQNPLEVSFTFACVADIVCLTFGKTFKQVEADLVQVIRDFPTDDFRTARKLRLSNLLH
ncbi:MAG: hypothetical protein E4H14_08395 [Candidatus Thorarchaeota archaeon]|nr:MAG: hypothetical protein E4H14_08395 [Candidatus Thorarchaeota archaeon]